MKNFHFTQYEQELFYNWWNHLNAYLTYYARYSYSYRKWKILGTVHIGVNYENDTLLEYLDFRSKSVDEAWDIREWLVSHTYKFKEVICCASGMSFHDPCTFHARSYCKEQFTESCSRPPQSDHITNFCSHIIPMDSRFKQLEQGIKNYRESMGNIKSTLIDQFLELVEHCTHVT